MPNYDASRFDPPAPVAQVTLRNINNGKLQTDVFLLLDTGADITLLPRAAVERLGAKPLNEKYELLGFDGNKSTAQAVELDMIFLKKAFRGRYLLIDDDQGVLGRDIIWRASHCSSMGRNRNGRNRKMGLVSDLFPHLHPQPLELFPQTANDIPIGSHLCPGA